MAEIFAYIVMLTGEVAIKAVTDEEAKTEALAYFAQAPMNYIVIKSKLTVIVPEP